MPEQTLKSDMSTDQPRVSECRAWENEAVGQPSLLSQSWLEASAGGRCKRATTQQTSVNADCQRHSSFKSI